MNSRESRGPRLRRPVGLPTRRARMIVGGFFISMGGVHLGIVAADPELYRSFADEALLGFVRTGWDQVFMAHPALWGLAVAAGETFMGIALLVGGSLARVGWAGVVAFHLALLLFGWGIWLWCVPALILLVYLARTDWPHLVRPPTATEGHDLPQTHERVPA